LAKELRHSYTKYSFKIKPFSFFYHMQHILEIYNHLTKTKSQRFTDKRKAEILFDEIKDASGTSAAEANLTWIQESVSGDALDFAYSVACGNADTWSTFNYFAKQ